MSDASLGCRDTLWVPGTLRTSCDQLILDVRKEQIEVDTDDSTTTSQRRG
jgi:hypothetical protein